jgi:fluoroacetyl-CoA thioesterase
MSKIDPGLTGTHHAVVAESDTAVAQGSGDVPVLSTPRLVAWLEAAAVAAVAGSLPSAMTTVGTRIEVDHLAPSGRGASIDAEAVVTQVDERRITFTVRAVERRIDGAEVPVARGAHQRVVVDRDRFVARAGS